MHDVTRHTTALIVFYCGLGNILLTVPDIHYYDLPHLRDINTVVNCYDNDNKIEWV